MGRARRVARSGRSRLRWLSMPRWKASNCGCLLLGVVLGACLLVTVAGVASAQTPVATTAPAPATTPGPGVVAAQPVVIVGYGEGARGVEQALLAVVLIVGTLEVITLFYILVSGGKGGNR